MAPTNPIGIANKNHQRRRLIRLNSSAYESFIIIQRADGTWHIINRIIPCVNITAGGWTGGPRAHSSREGWCF
jgi:hypothetical protein